MKKKLIIALVALLLVAGLAVGAFFIIKHISDENHKKDIEMAADCARSFEEPNIEYVVGRGYVDSGAYNQYRNNRRAKLQECAEKYHVTHQEIIDKLGGEDYRAI